MRRTNIYLPDDQTEALDRIAADEGVSRAAVVRRLLERGLGLDDPGAAADLAAFDESFGGVPEVVAPDRGTGEREQHLDSLWRARA